MKKNISLFVVSAIAVSACAGLAGCSGDNNYPVSVADVTIESKPENIVVLSDKTADIISYMSYDRIMVGRSDEVNQDFLSVVQSVGSAQSPDVNLIKAMNTDIVFADDSLDEGVKNELTDGGILVLNIASPETTTELETAYITLGKIFGGAQDGAKEGQDSYKELVDTMKSVKLENNTAGISKTICYLYLEGDKLNTLHSGTYGDMLLGYTGAVNAAVNVSESEIDTNVLKIANPDYILYADDATLEFIKKDDNLKNLKAVKNNQVLMVTKPEIERMGKTSLLTLDKIVNFMYPDRAKADNKDNTSATQSATKAQGTTAATQPATKPVSSASVESQYKIKVSGLSLKLDDENDNVKAMQQRLFDLGYVTDKENITGYYGEITEKAVKEFQKANGIKETGTADNKTLTAMFKSDAKSKA